MYCSQIDSPGSQIRHPNPAVPAGHSPHEEDASLPLVYFPRAQVSHEVADRSSDISSTLHLVHDGEPFTGWCFPGMQGRQNADPGTCWEYPALHSVQAVNVIVLVSGGCPSRNWPDMHSEHASSSYVHVLVSLHGRSFPCFPAGHTLHKVPACCCCENPNGQTVHNKEFAASEKYCTLHVSHVVPSSSGCAFPAGQLRQRACSRLFCLKPCGHFLQATVDCEFSIYNPASQDVHFSAFTD